MNQQQPPSQVVQRQEKQNLIREEILGKGYDPKDFEQYMLEKKPLGNNVDIWSYSQIQYVMWYIL
jgi:hypothetical protein